MSIDVKPALGVDYYLMDELLTDQERAVRDKVHDFCDREVIPIINDYWERAEFPFELIPKLAQLNIAGSSLKGYGRGSEAEMASTDGAHGKARRIWPHRAQSRLRRRRP